MKTVVVNVRLLTAIAAAFAVVGATAEPADNPAVSGNALAIINASLIDGTGAPPRRTSINVRDGVIVSIGGPPQPDARLLDAQGMAVLPGLIDSHVHFQAVPGAVHRQDNADARRALMHRHLRAHVANGVTTVLDAAIASEALREIRAYLAAGGLGPRVMALGPTFHNPGGYMDGAALSEYWAPRWRASATPDDVDALYREYGGIEDLVGVKVAATHGHGSPIDIYDTHSPQMLAVIRQRAADHGRPIYVHVDDHRGVNIAFGLSAHALTHLVGDRPSGALLDRMRRANMHVIPTLYIYESFTMRYRPDLLDAPMVRLTVPAVERETARDPMVWDLYFKRFILLVAPDMPEWLAGWWGDMYLTEGRMQSLVRNLQENLMLHHEAGVPIAMGTDSGGWPHMPNMFHGPTALREMELMAEAGMTPAEVLRAATVTPARMMGIEDLVGTVEVGKRADLIVVRGDPLKSISALRELEWVIKDGEPRRPVQWMAQ
ncbi:MAG: amidohydrolase family protein [Gammaproteobacteria bacterium]|nr:amidohydrolase family protein [Gammaproteobacteria bacterium]MYK84540.1 amidohydrolase family protein [Gammaproteobacteria bacterium]